MKFSGHPRLPRSISLLALLFALASVSSLSRCAPDNSVVSPEITVVVTVAGAPADATSLYVTTTLNNNAPAQPGQEVSGRLDQFAIALPLTTTGHLEISVAAHSSEGCVVATGKVALDIATPPPTRYTATLTLDPLPAGAAKSCTLTVTVSGKGTVTSTPAGIECVGTGKASGGPTECRFDFPVGTAISLKTASDPRIYGVTYSGLCSDPGPCNFTFNGPGSVQIGIGNRVCSTDKWCWDYPLPQGNTLRSIWGSAANDIWAVGDAGTIVHYDGVTWSSPIATGEAGTQDLYSIYGTSANNIWAVGAGGTLVHWNGTKWELSSQSGLASTQLLNSVWGSGNEYWAVGGAGTILHFDGMGWSGAAGNGQLTTSTLYSMWGSGPSDIWAVGSGSAILHYNGTAWALDPKSGQNGICVFRTIGGSGPGNAWIGGTCSLPFPSRSIYLKYDTTASSWNPGPTTGTNTLSSITGIWGSSGSNGIWMGGYSSTLVNGAAAHYDGNTWTTQSAIMPSYALLGIWGTSDTNIWAVSSYGMMVHYDGNTWSTPPLVSPPAQPNTLNSVWANGSNDVWAVGYGGIIRHNDGQGWTNSLQSGVSTTQPLFRVHGISSSNVTAVGGGGVVLQYSGGTWSTPIAYTTNAKTDYLYGLWAPQPSSNMWAVGYNGALATYNNSTMALNGFIPTPATTAGFRSVWGFNSSNIFAVGYTGAIYRYNGNWTAVVSPTSNDLYGIWGTASNNTAWAVGTSGTLLRYNGSTWATESVSGTITTQSLYAVWAAPTNLVWAVGSVGTVLRYDGTSWALQNSGTHSYLYGVYGISPTEIWAVGDGFTTLRYIP